MGYDPQKYREKREKVLGIQRKGPGFGTIAGIVSAAIILGLGAVTVPQAISYMTTRHQDDAIYKLSGDSLWPDTVIQKIQAMDGIRAAGRDRNQTRLVVTFDRRSVQLSQIETLMKEQGLDAVLLNQVSHNHHQAFLGEEEEF